jgi:hypothetical protein
MSNFWETYTKKVEEGSAELTNLPKEIDQNLIWLKAFVLERLSKEGMERFVGKDDTFGLKESAVNLLMHYAYEAGIKSREHSFNRQTEDMRKALDGIKSELDDIGWIEY